MNAYTLEDGAITGHNRPFYNNRPLYGDHRPSVALAGDRPHVRFACKPNVYGCLTLALQRGAAACWLHDSAQVISRYRPGRMEWEVCDPRVAGLTIRIEVVPLPAAEGFAAKLTTQGAQSGDRLIWAFGGSVPVGDASAQFDSIVGTVIEEGNTRLSPVLTQCFRPQDCTDNHVCIESDRFVLTTNGTVRQVAGRCTTGDLRLADASAWERPAALPASSADALPLACGVVDLSDSAQTHWAVEALQADGLASPACDDPAGAFGRAMARVEALAERIVLETPDPLLDAGVAAACYAMDATFYPPVYVHGAMAWNIPFPGWRSIYGATAFGWHDNVKTEARYYIASQNRETTARVAQASPARRLCTQAAESRYHGRGRITRDDGPYNFQTQFFDQLVHAWRWTGDAELEALLREALDLHLEWAKACFDPDDDGLYESYINTWPTDSVWYNGGGSAEESSYAFAGHRAAAEMARRAGDDEAATRHDAQADKIRAALLGALWIGRKGYMAQYKEQGGHQRVHEDSWLGAIFLPVESGLLDISRAVQALYYTEWGLQRVPLPFGGSRCWMSNWVPAPWSARELHPGDDYALALAYFGSGLADDGWDILKGNYLASMYHGVVPGGLAAAHCGTDFSDILSMFCRTVVEGLFGYHPDYPNGRVQVAPQFPAAWDKASITTPDVRIRYDASGDVQEWTVSVTQPARLVLDLPVRAQKLSGVEVNGQAIAWTVAPGFGCSIVHIETDSCNRAQVTLNIVAASVDSPSMAMTTEVGQGICLTAGAYPILEFQDPQEVLTDATLTDGRVDAQVAANPGHHLLQAVVGIGDLTQRRLFKLQVGDPRAEATQAARSLSDVPPGPTWACCDMRAAMNADVCTIYRQEYLSPRPETCSLRIGSDGYSPWTFAYWKTPVPDIDLSHVPNLLDASGHLQTPSGVPFAWSGDTRNIAFTSLWDNWPTEVTVPVGRQGDAVWFLLCGSTNPMQCRIANARLRLTYADGGVDDLDVVPPMNFWTLCPLGGADYNYGRDAFALPPSPPPTVQLGGNCRAVLLNARLRRGVELMQVTLEALSQDVVIGLMGITVMNGESSSRKAAQ